MKILTLNCQKAYQKDFGIFMRKILLEETYDFVLLQEANTTVLNIINEIKSSYKILNPFDLDLKENSHDCILYKQSYALKENFLISFAKFNPKMPPRGWGFLYGVFEANDKIFIAGSVHLHPGIKSNIRKREVEIIKEELKKYIGKDYPIIFGGDFNSGFKNETLNFNKILFPEFINVTNNISSTLDSRYTENAPFLLNKLAVFFAHFNIGIQLKTDHIYVDATSSRKVFSSKVLSERISDHSAMTILFE